MNYRILYGVMFLSIISVGAVFAQESLISVQTDDSNYDEGDTIVVSGKVTTLIGDTPIILQLFLEENIVDIAQIVVAQDGSYSHTIIAEGPLWKKQGNYIARVSYGEGDIVETEFGFTPHSGAITTTKNFEVDAGSYGTFDVEHSVKGGTLKDITIDSNNFALIVEIESIEEGVITLDLPREFIDAKKQDGKDETFIILIDGIGATYLESSTDAKSRTMAINFEKEDKVIEIIGTYAIPEFGAVVMAIITVGIMITVLVSRSKFQIKF
ncbi:MAG: PEFG-CTERM sorting domain-containing protein [Nitrosopumilus sp.]